jgi:hypothetical protein
VKADDLGNSVLGEEEGRFECSDTGESWIASLPFGCHELGSFVQTACDTVHGPMYCKLRCDSRPRGARTPLEG